MTPAIRERLAALRAEFAQRSERNAAERRRNYWLSVLHRATYHASN